MVTKFSQAFKVFWVLLVFSVLSASTALAGPPVTSLGRWVQEHPARATFRCDLRPPYSTVCQRTVVFQGVTYLWTYTQTSSGFAASGRRLDHP